MQTILDDKFLKSIEDHARIIALGAGRILANHFGKRLQIEYKDTARTDPVTNADIESEEFLIKSISERFPGHGIISEEGISNDTLAEDLIWILDPLDGTRNFMSGLPVYACSVGVLYKGSPIVGAVFMPWPNDRGGIVIHARRGGIAYKDEAPIPENRNTPSHVPSIVGLPANFDTAYKFRVIPRETSWEPRVTGSIAFELGLITLGILPYSLFISPKLWDVAAGVTIIRANGGQIMQELRPRSRDILLGRTHWEPIQDFVSPSFQEPATYNDFRQWSRPLVAGNCDAISYVTKNLKRCKSQRKFIRQTLSRLKT